MGLEAICRAHHDGRSSEGRVHLDTDFLLFRGDFRLKIWLRDMKAVEAKEGQLTIQLLDGPVAFDLDRPETWAKKILHPPSLLDKLGIKPGQRVVLLGRFDPVFVAELKRRDSTVATRLGKAADIIMFQAEDKKALEKLSSLPAALQPAGSIWVVFPRGVKIITEADVLAAIRTAHLVDVKVARFSDTHTALKAVIPTKARGK